MSRKSSLPYYEVFNAVDMTAPHTSDVTNVINLDNSTITVDWTSSAINGELILEFRNKKPTSPLDEPVPWQEVDFGSPILINVDNSSHSIILNSMPGSEIRFRYVPTSGTGNLTIRMSAKVVGA